MAKGAARQIETIEIRGGPKGRLIVNARDLAMWRKLGYRPIGEEEVKRSGAGSRGRHREE